MRMGDERIAGIVFHRARDAFFCDAFGALGEDGRSGKSGAAAGIFHFCIREAREMGCRQVDFGGFRPSLDDGLLRFKRKFGVRLVKQRDATCEGGQRRERYLCVGKVWGQILRKPDGSGVESISRKSSPSSFGPRSSS